MASAVPLYNTVLQSDIDLNSNIPINTSRFTTTNGSTAYISRGFEVYEAKSLPYTSSFVPIFNYYGLMIGLDRNGALEFTFNSAEGLTPGDNFKICTIQRHAWVNEYPNVGTNIEAYVNTRSDRTYTDNINDSTQGSPLVYQVIYLGIIDETNNHLFYIINGN